MTDNNTLGDLTPPEAYQKLQDDPRAILVDIRSNMEFLFVGHPKGSVHVPWIDEPDWVVNPDFVSDVRQLLLGGACDGESEAAAVILICRSGKRTKEAAKALFDAGINNVFHVSEGFEGELDENHQRGNLGGWRYHGLPWRQC